MLVSRSLVVAVVRALGRRFAVPLVLGLPAAGVCLAQSAANVPSDATPSGVPILQEVVVTALKRSTSEQDAAVSMNVIGAQQLQQSGVQSFEDILRDVPGVSFTETGVGQANYNIRGISTNSNSPTVGIYLDGVSLTTVATVFSGAIDPALFDMSRVEVLKGPQGTLYGGSAMGGAIKYVSQPPLLTQSTLDLGSNVAGIEHGGLSYGGQAVLNAPIIDNVLAVRAGVLYRRDGGFVDSVPDAPYLNYQYASTSPPQPFAPTASSSLSVRSEKDENADHTLVLRLSARWRPDPSLEITPSLFGQYTHQDDAGIFWTNLPGLESSFRIPQPTDDRLWVDDLTVVKHLSGVDITSLTGYVRRDLLQDRDYSFYVGGLVPPLYGLISANASDTYTRTVSQELWASSNDPLSRLQYTAGLYFSDQHDHLAQAVQTLGAAAIPSIGTDTVYLGSIRTTTRQYAVYADASYSLLPQLNLLDLDVGLRGFRIEQSQSVGAGGLFNGGNSFTAGSETQNGVSPKVELSSQLTRDHLVYTSATKGFRPGGPNGSFSSSLCGASLRQLGIAGVPPDFGSDNLWTYEIGSKNQVLHRRLTLNGAVYYTDWKKIQQTILLPSCGFSYTANVGAASVKGVELSARQQIGTGLLVGIGADYTNAEITQTAPGVTAQVGQEVLNTPKWSGNAYAAYHLRVGADSMLQMRADYQYHGSQRRDFATTFPSIGADGVPELIPNFAQVLPSYSVVNLGLQLSRGAWEFELFANNILDKRPIIGLNPTEPYNQAFTIQPLTIGLSVRTELSP